VNIHRQARRFSAGALAFALASCTTTQAQFNKKPEAVSKAALCKTILETPDPLFYQQLLSELSRRGISIPECQQMVQQQKQAAAALVAVALVGTAVAVCANGNCGGGYTPSYGYRGNCQYDWQYDAAGNRCGRRSAWSRPGGF
jgi:hypothetical protein